MQTHNLQISLEFNTDNDPEYEIHVTPVDLKIPEEAAKYIQKGIQMADMVDAEPGDDALQIPAKFKVPTKIRIFGKNIDFTVDAQVEVKVVAKGEPTP